jgi:hypothetical protein
MTQRLISLWCYICHEFTDHDPITEICVRCGRSIEHAKEGGMECLNQSE